MSRRGRQTIEGDRQAREVGGGGGRVGRIVCQDEDLICPSSWLWGENQVSRPSPVAVTD